MSSIQTLVHCDDPISRTGVISQLRPRPEIRIVNESEIIDGTVALVIIDRLGDNDIQTMRRLSRLGCRLVLVVSDLDDTALVSAAEAGALGLIRRIDATAESLTRVIEQAAAGHGELPSDLAGRLLQQVGRLQRHVLLPRGLTFAGLTDRESDVLRLVADGHDTAEIAAKLCYSQRTVKNVLHNLTTRLQLRNRSHAVAYAVREGLI